MTRYSPNRFSSMDGFVPGGQGRHVGFGDKPKSPPKPINGGRRPLSALGGKRLNTRRPGLHSKPASRSAVVMGDGLVAGKAAKRNAGPAPFGPPAPRRSRNNSDDLGSISNFGGAEGLTRRTRRARADDMTSLKPDSRGNRKAGKRSLRNVNWKTVFKRGAIIMSVLVLLVGGWLGWRFFQNSRKVFGGDSSILGFLNSTKLKGEDKGRVNILLAGVSTDDPGHQGAELTDSIMLASIDTVNKKAFLMSVPRDMWVPIPGYGHAKINAANAYGEADKFSGTGYPSGGMGLLQKVVNNNFDLPIHYYAKINYSAFRDAVNAVGGIDVNIQSTDPRGFYDPNISKADNGPLRLKNGPQRLDGQTALNLARARGDPTGDGRIAYGYERSDFTRTQNQRMMMVALKDRGASSSVVANPLKVSQLFDVVGKNVKTDLQPSEIRRLYDINKQIKQSDVQSVSLNDFGGVNLLASYRTPDGASALIPADGLDDFDTIKLSIKKLFSNDPVVKESAKIVILNGGGTTGMASKESNSLTAKGLNIVAVGDAARQIGPDIIIDMSAKQGSAKPGTLNKLKQLFGTSIVQNDNTKYGYPTADFIVVLGTDHKPTATSAAGTEATQ